MIYSHINFTHNILIMSHAWIQKFCPQGRGASDDFVGVFFFKETRWLKIYVLLFDYDNGNKKSYSKFHHTKGLTHHKLSPINLQVIKTHPENAHVNKPSCFGHWYCVTCLRFLSKNSYSGIDTLKKEFEFEAIRCLW